GREGEQDEDEEKRKRDEEQHFGDRRGGGRNAGKAEIAGNQRDHQKDQSPFQHVFSPFRVTVKFTPWPFVPLRALFSRCALVIGKRPKMLYVPRFRWRKGERRRGTICARIAFSMVNSPRRKS